MGIFAAARGHIGRARARTDDKQRLAQLLRPDQAGQRLAAARNGCQFAHGHDGDVVDRFRQQAVTSAGGGQQADRVQFGVTKAQQFFDLGR